MRNISLKNLIIYYTLIIFFIPIATIGIGAIGTIFITSKQALVDKNSLLLENISNNIDKKIDHSIRELEVFEFYTENESSLFSKNIDNLAKSILGDKNYFESIYICDKNGQLLYTNPFLKEIQDINYSELEYIKRTIFTKKTLLETRFLNEEDNNLRIIINYPILKNDTLLGVISGTINLNDIEKTIEFQKNKELGLNIAILDDKNNLIYYSNNNKYVNISELLKKSKEISGLNIVKINNIKNVVFHRFVPKLKWNIVLTQEISFAFKTAYFLRSIVVIYFIIGVLITILTIILGYYLIFRPLIEISYLTAKIAHNDYNLTFKDSLIKELNILAHNFNRMTKKILVKEKQLIDSEFKYRKLIEESLDFFFKVSDKMKFTFISPSIEKTIGYTSEEFLKGFTKHLRTNKNNKKIINVSKMIFETQKIPEPFVFEIISKSGEIHILEIQLTPIIEDNHVVELQGSARDITMRYNVEKEINYLKNYLYSIIESMPSAVITMNQLGIINQFNSTAKKMIGVDDSDIKGKVLWNISERFHDYKKYFMESLAKNTSLEFREEIKVNNKEIKYYNITFFPLNIMEQKEIVIRIDDVTKIEKAELQLRQAQKLEIIGTMAGGLAHDFNNILGAILGTLTLIEYRTKNKKTISYNILQDDLKTIKDASSKATGIIQQLMTLSRKQSIKMETIDLNEEIRQVVNICRNSFSKQLKIDVKYYKEAAWAEANPGQIEQMILNLLVNAKDAIQNEGTIEISLEKMVSDIVSQKNHTENQGIEFWHLKISDNGYGIPEEYKEQIFDPFFTTKDKGKGTGLGLTMVYNIIKQHKGFVDFDSEVTKGTVFNIYLPSKTIHTAVVTQNEDKPQIPKGSGIILLVDDDEYIRYTAGEILKECGYEVIKAKDGEEGVLLFKENHKRISGVLLDMVMPNKTGKDAYIEMKKIDKNVKVLLSSAVKTDPRVSETMILGVKYFLLKPYSLEELASAIYTLIYSQ